MSYKNAKVGSDAWWNKKIEEGTISCKPGQGKCMFCGNNMKANDRDSVCKNCINTRLRK